MLYLYGIKEGGFKMDEKQALEILNDGTTDWKEIISVLILAKKALERQVPEKPLEIKGMKHRGVCPKCKSIHDPRSLYCGDCGQKLDWRK